VKAETPPVSFTIFGRAKYANMYSGKDNPILFFSSFITSPAELQKNILGKVNEKP